MNVLIDTITWTPMRVYEDISSAVYILAHKINLPLTTFRTDSACQQNDQKFESHIRWTLWL